MAEGNGTKVVVGCCSAVAVLAVIAGMATFIFLKRGVDWVKDASESQREIAVSLEEWQAAMDAAGGDPAKASPAVVGSFERVSQTNEAAAPNFDLQRTGLLTVYRSDAASQSVRVWIAALGTGDGSAVVEQVSEQVEQRFNVRSTSSFTMNGNSRMTYQGSSPDETGLLVIGDGWIILLQSDDKSTDLEGFLSDYAEAALQAVQPADPDPVVVEPVEPVEPAEAEAATAPQGATAE